MTLAGLLTVWVVGIVTAAPPLAPGFHRGVNYAHIHRHGHGYGSEISARELSELKQLGIDSIAITPFGYQRGATASEIVGFPGREGASEFFGSTDPTMTDADLRAEIAAARQLGLRVMVKPQIWSHDFRDAKEWYGTIRQATPEQHAQWWASYRQFILHYARLAAEARADIFCIGNELVEMTRRHPEQWRSLAEETREVAWRPDGTRMRLIYAAHWDEEWHRISFWDALDWIGINAYYPLDAPTGATVEALVEAWEPWRKKIEEVQARVGRKVVFPEIGYRPVDNCHQEPWVYSGGQPDPEAQARAFEALFRVFRDSPWWEGVYIWKTFTDPELARRGAEDTGFTFRGRSAAATVRRWFSH